MTVKLIKILSIWFVFNLKSLFINAANNLFFCYLYIWSVSLDNCFDRRINLQTSISEVFTPVSPLELQLKSWPLQSTCQSVHGQDTEAQIASDAASLLCEWVWMVTQLPTTLLTTYECDKRETLWETDRLERRYVNANPLTTYRNFFWYLDWAIIWENMNGNCGPTFKYSRVQKNNDGQPGPWCLDKEPVSFKTDSV